jgi:hypothetical protein
MVIFMQKQGQVWPAFVLKVTTLWYFLNENGRLPSSIEKVKNNDCVYIFNHIKTKLPF